MQIGRKIYYEKLTGDVILITPEKFSGIATTKEQDFAMYEVLSIYNPESVDVIELEYGQYSSDFQTANSVRVDVQTGNLLFNYPVFEQPLSVKVNNLEAENTELKAQNEALQQQVADLEMAIAAILGGGM
ncbi:MAG: hypothetical protein GX666_12475 [Tissierellia bacterium]|nr:hypothetical protein [Tissierellia bacterium]